MADVQYSGRENPRRLEDFDAEIDEIDNVRASIIDTLIKVAPERALLFQQADWHIRGLLYHLRQIRRLYEPATRNVVDMAAGDPTGNILITTAPEMPELVFAFYAFISLARVTLDQLLRFAAPAINIHADQTPKSITDVLKWETDFPVYIDLATKHRLLLQYLIDIRDCIVHHRTFASSEGMVAVEEGFPEEKVPDMSPMWFRSVIRTYFRRLGGLKVVANISLPDAIYNYKPSGERGTILATFSYGKVNLLSQSRSFAQFCTSAVLSTLSEAVSGKKYDLRKPRR